jgi:DTW domain-containing protein YfiP
VCLCAAITPIHTRTRVLILQHRREREVPVNTARLAELALPNSELFVGLDFSNDARVRAAVTNPEAPAIVLYPGDGARSLEREPPSGPVTLVVVDGTWSLAGKLFKHNPWLRALPRYALDPREASRYRIRRAPALHCISTVEAIVQALSVLEGGAADVERVLDPFDRMVEQQLTFATERQVRRHFRKKTTPSPPSGLVQLASRGESLVVAYGEANAWPKGTPLGSSPELVHFGAERLASGERFEAFVRPQHPLAPSFAHHTSVPPDFVLRGEPRESFRERFSAFMRPDDTLCCWGYYAALLLKAEVAALPDVLDVRALVRRILRRSVGDVQECARLLEAPVPPTDVVGRTGARLSALNAVTRALVGRAPGTQTKF